MSGPVSNSKWRRGEQDAGEEWQEGARAPAGAGEPGCTAGRQPGRGAHQRRCASRASQSSRDVLPLVLSQLPLQMRWSGQTSGASFHIRSLGLIALPALKMRFSTSDRRSGWVCTCGFMCSCVPRSFCGCLYVASRTHLPYLFCKYPAVPGLGMSRRRLHCESRCGYALQPRQTVHRFVTSSYLLAAASLQQGRAGALSTEFSSP